MRLRMAVVGVGHLGKEHARILASMPQVELVGVADAYYPQAQAVAQRLGTQAFAECWPLLNLVDAACIVVPTSLHCEVAGAFLKRGLPLLVEKPLATTLAEADTLVNLAEQNQTFLQVGHIERFNPAFEEVCRRPLQPKFVRAERLAPFSGRSTDIGVVLDLMIHDIDLVLTLVKSTVTSVQAVGVRVFGQHEDLANARVHFANGCVADITASRAHPTAHRQLHIWGPEGYAGLDLAQRRVTLVQPSSELRSHGLDVGKLDAGSRARIKDELFSRHFETLQVDGQAQDQLTAELQNFVHCVRTGNKPRVSGYEARDAIAVAEQILGSMQMHAWEGAAGGLKGPHHIPAPLGALFSRERQQEAA